MRRSSARTVVLHPLGAGILGGINKKAARQGGSASNSGQLFFSAFVIFVVVVVVAMFFVVMFLVLVVILLVLGLLFLRVFDALLPMLIRRRFGVFQASASRPALTTVTVTLSK